MTEVNLEALFPTLEAQAARLNDASASVNRTLAALEKRLVDLNVGIEVWHSLPIDKSIPEGGFGRDETSTRVVRYLGLARVSGKWCLAVKPVRYVSGFFEGDTGSPFENQYADDPVPLLGSPRELRIAALRSMPAFLEELTEKVSETVSDIERASCDVARGPRSGPTLIK